MFYALKYAFNAWRKFRQERRWVRVALAYCDRQAKPTVYRGRWM